MSATKSGKKLGITPSFQFAARIWRRECQVSILKGEGKHKGRIKSGGWRPLPMTNSCRRGGGKPESQISKYFRSLIKNCGPRRRVFRRLCATMRDLALEVAHKAP